MTGGIREGVNMDNPPPHYLSSLSCNIIIHLITSVFLPSPSSLLTLPNYLLRILFSSVVIVRRMEKKERGVVRRIERERMTQRKEGER
jgi:hypothetical protein